MQQTITNLCKLIERFQKMKDASPELLLPFLEEAIVELRASRDKKLVDALGNPRKIPYGTEQDTSYPSDEFIVLLVGDRGEYKMPYVGKDPEEAHAIFERALIERVSLGLDRDVRLLSPGRKLVAAARRLAYMPTWPKYDVKTAQLSRNQDEEKHVVREPKNKKRKSK